MFHGIERSYTKEMIKAARAAQRTLCDTVVEDAVSGSHVKFKDDTLGLDQKPENTLVSYLQAYDPYCVIIAEERGIAANPFAVDGPMTVQGARTFFGSDPLDRSNQLQAFLTKYSNPGERVADVLRNKQTRKRWEKDWSYPASITGATTSITCVRRGLPISTVILNHITNEMTVACAAGIYNAKMPEDINTDVTLDSVQETGVRLFFPQPPYDEAQQIVSFIGKPERGYPANFANCKLVSETTLEKHLHYNLCGGPSRVLYLSNLQPQNTPIGVVVANGEKSNEWIHWLAFMRFARRFDDISAPALRIFEVSQNQSLMIDGYLMMPSPDYSFFEWCDNQRRKVFISSDRLQKASNPSKLRETLIMIPASNRWALDRTQLPSTKVEGLRRRER